METDKFYCEIMDDVKNKMYPADISVIPFVSKRAHEIVALSKMIGKSVFI